MAYVRFAGFTRWLKDYNTEGYESLPCRHKPAPFSST